MYITQAQARWKWFEAVVSKIYAGAVRVTYYFCDNTGESSRLLDRHHLRQPTLPSDGAENAGFLHHMLAWEVQSTNELLWTAILHVYATPGDLTMVITITGKTLIQLHTETHYQFSMQHCPASGITQHACKFLVGVDRADQKHVATWAEIVFRAGQHRPFDTPLKSLGIGSLSSGDATQPHSLYCIMRIDRL